MDVLGGILGSGQNGAPHKNKQNNEEGSESRRPFAVQHKAPLNLRWKGNPRKKRESRAITQRILAHSEKTVVIILQNKP
jgi:hypothetical protein